MLPPLALAPRQGEAVLDMCASPGSKTGFLGQLTGPDGFVLGNELSRARLATLRANLHACNLPHVGTCSFEGRPDEKNAPWGGKDWRYSWAFLICSVWRGQERPRQGAPRSAGPRRNSGYGFQVARQAKCRYSSGAAGRTAPAATAAETPAGRALLCEGGRRTQRTARRF